MSEKTKKPEEAKKADETKKPEAKKPTPKAKPKIDYKKINKQLEDKIKLLETQVLKQELENKKNIIDFQDKAKGFQKKAQEEVNKIKDTLHKKLQEDSDHVKKYGSQKMLESILEIILNIELAVRAGANQDGAVKAYVSGFAMLLNQLDNELEAFGVVKVVPKAGDAFNPEVHHAISTDDSAPKNQIVSVKKMGYLLHERLIKPATVVIGTKEVN